MTEGYDYLIAVSQTEFNDFMFLYPKLLAGVEYREATMVKVQGLRVNRVFITHKAAVNNQDVVDELRQAMQFNAWGNRVFDVYPTVLIMTADQADLIHFHTGG